MSFISWFMQKQCSHNREDLVLRTDRYETGKEEKMVYCSVCGKTVLPKEDFNVMKELLENTP